LVSQEKKIISMINTTISNIYHTVKLPMGGGSLEVGDAVDVGISLLFSISND
jgi:hypothetical protein